MKVVRSRRAGTFKYMSSNRIEESTFYKNII